MANESDVEPLTETRGQNTLQAIPDGTNGSLNCQSEHAHFHLEDGEHIEGTSTAQRPIEETSRQRPRREKHVRHINGTMLPRWAEDLRSEQRGVSSEGEDADTERQTAYEHSTEEQPPAVYASSSSGESKGPSFDRSAAQLRSFLLGKSGHSLKSTTEIHPPSGTTHALADHRPLSSHLPPVSDIAPPVSSDVAPHPDPNSPDIDPDAEWKNAIRERIEIGLQTMIKEATKAVESQLREAPAGPRKRQGLTDKYFKAIANIWRLAEEAFEFELERRDRYHNLDRTGLQSSGDSGINLVDAERVGEPGASVSPRSLGAEKAHPPRYEIWIPPSREENARRDSQAEAGVQWPGVLRGKARGPDPDERSLKASKFATIVARLTAVFEDVVQYKKFLSCQKSQAQRLLDLFQTLLDSPQMEASFRRSLVVATQRLSKKTDLYPKCFDLKGVRPVGEHPITGGSFADIYKGSSQNRHVCLKVIKIYQRSQIDYILKQFAHEAILWGQMSHPNLLPFYGLYHFRSRLCLVSPWMDNGDINNFLQQNPMADRFLLTLDTAAGVSYLHANGIIHGDLKGANILVNSSGRACLADFGLSAVTDPQILIWTSHSSAASKGGSMRWQAPELFDIEGDDIVHNSKATDVYAWSCVCYEIFIGNVPFFESSRDSAVMLKVKQGKQPSRPSMPGSSWDDWGLTEVIWSLMKECWKVDPDERPSIDQAIARLDSEATVDKRPIGAWGALSPLYFRNNVSGSQDYPSIEELERMLSGGDPPSSA